jgi:hypothetical protein
MKLLFPLLMSLLPAASVLTQTQEPSPQPPSGVPSPKTTEVMVIQTVKQGVTRQQVMNVMPAEIRATVKLYLDGKIRQWYSRGDGRGVVVLLDVKTVEEAHTIIAHDAIVEREPDGSRVHSRGSPHAADCLDWRCAGWTIKEDRSCHFQLYSESV